VPGETTWTAVLVLNLGGRDAGPSELAVGMPSGTTIRGDLPGCTTAPDRRSITCRYDGLTTLDGDEEHAGDILAFPVRVDASVVGPRTLTGGTAVLRDQGALGPAPTLAARTAAVRNPVGAARLAALTGDADQGDNSDTFVATVVPVANISVVTGPVRVSGSTATVPFTVRSNGPAVATGVYAEITAPTGTTFAGVPADCTRVGRRMACDLAERLAPGASIARSVRLSLTGAPVGRDGSIVAGSDSEDLIGSDNTVPIEIPGTLVQARLPVTGTRSGMVAGTGAALLLLGGALVLAGRRRRPVAVTA
jgi:LPXTG-motif cell wall-anchored protein